MSGDNFSFRLAQPSDSESIARLHAVSWQNAYRGILNYDYLDHDLLKEKLSSWAHRLSRADPKLWILLAEQGDDLCGFVCLCLDHDPELGALMDNLHIKSELKGTGLGKKLIKQVFNRIKQNQSKQSLYLWVFENNKVAVNFYLKFGGTIQEKQIQDAPGGGTVLALKIIWMDLSAVSV